MPHKDPEKARAQVRRWREANREAYLASRRRSYQKAKPHRAVYLAKYKEKHGNRIAEYNSKFNARKLAEARAAAFALLGGPRCVECGFDDVRALQIDHINGGGRAHRESCSSIFQYYKDIMAAGRLEFQVLCANCNRIKAAEQGQVTKRKRKYA